MPCYLKVKSIVKLDFYENDYHENVIFLYGIGIFRPITFECELHLNAFQIWTQKSFKLPILLINFNVSLIFN